jgi:hypothetical protein
MNFQKDNPLRDPSHELYGVLVESLRRHRRSTSSDHVTYESHPSTYSKLVDNLWMGGYPPPDARLGEHFDCLVLCAREYQVPECFGDVQVAQAMLDDSGCCMTKEEQQQAVKAAGRVIKWLNDGLKVLVTCFAGRNRSGLVSAIALCKGPNSMTPQNATKLIRLIRGPNALSNPQFVAFLNDFCG